ncbi:Lar family restriction alleviation protein [Pseudomonas sp. JH-2]|uniref:Lar family restriction alleviation protein n=1 Tax=Pseudomonas sp. JH-2 TaxID=3114998 RepID=UPI002E26CBEE|nr:Lar family restriction alleviation protein [Pseudomonas sp. JH-2]
MNKILNLLLPRFLTEEVALHDNGDHLVIVCPMTEVKPGERFHAVATMRVFNLFGRTLLPRMVSGPWPWPSIPDIEPSELPPCPFCEGPPSITVQSFELRGPVYRQAFYGCAGVDIDAYVFCHACGAQGPQYENVIFHEVDYLSAEVEAARLWIERSAKHRDLYDGSAADGLTIYPRRGNRA